MRWTPAALRISLLGIVLNTPIGVACAQVGTQPGTTTATAPAAREGAARTLHDQFLQRAAQGNIDLLFLGDSITQGWSENPVWRRYYGPRQAANFGIGGDRTQHILWRLAHGEVDGLAPKVVVLMIGTNNLNDNSPAEIAEGVEAIVEDLRERLPDAKILLLGVFPRGKTRAADLEADEPDPRISEVNALIAGLGERDGVTYLDIGTHFLDADGKVPKDLMPDFLHLSRKGYRIWAEAMEPTLWSLMEGDAPEEG